MNHEGEKVKLCEPVGEELPAQGFAGGNEGYIAPGRRKVEINVNPHSQRLAIADYPSLPGKGGLTEYALTD